MEMQEKNKDGAVAENALSQDELKAVSGGEEQDGRFIKVSQMCASSPQYGPRRISEEKSVSLDELNAVSGGEEEDGQFMGQNRCRVANALRIFNDSPLSQDELKAVSGDEEQDVGYTCPHLAR